MSFKTLKQQVINHLADISIKLAKRTFYHPIGYLEHDSIKESAAFIKPHLNHVSLFDSKKGSYFKYLMEEVKKIKKPGLWLEFGVRDGVSAKFFSQYAKDLALDNCIYGFDSFEGIRDNWSSIGEPSGSFTLGGKVPKAIPNCTFVVGWVEDTLENFLEQHPSNINFINFDFDVYPPTKFALSKVVDRFVPGTIILFDEFHGYPGWQFHEKKALDEVLQPEKYEFIAFSRKQAAIRIK